MSSATRLFLIDGNNQMYRAYHALHGLTGPDGRSTNAVYGFVAMLRKLIGEQQPDLVAAAFDLRGPTFRNELSPDYKANRRPMPDDLVEQVPWVHEACAALGVPIVTHAGFEADDVIGTLATRAMAAGVDVVVVTGDKDFSSSWATSSGCSIPGMRVPGTTPPGCSRSSRRVPTRWSTSSP